MKTYRSLPNNSDGIFPVSFSVHPPFILRSSSVRAPFKLRSSSVRSPFVLRSSSVRAPFKLRSSSVRAPFELRSFSVHPPFELRSSSVQAPFELRSSSVRAPFGLRSISVRSPFNLRSISVRSPFVLRSFSVRSPFILRSFSVRRSKIDRRNIGESSEARRRCIETLTGSQGKGDPNKNFIFASNDILKSVRHCDKKNPNKHWGSEPILTFRNTINLPKNLESAFSCCNFVLARLLKHAPFWRIRIPMTFRYHTEGTQYAFWSYFLTLKRISS